MKEISVVDYGVGNLFSVAHALEECGVNVKFVTKPEDILSAEKLILPGVGAFGDCIGEIRKRGIDEAIVEYAKSGKLLLGICVGMQVMLTKSFEFGEHAGLDLIPGTVEKISTSKTNGDSHKVPYVGWSKLQIAADSVQFDKIRDEWCYFVHSYMAKPNNPNDTKAHYDYNGHKITAIIAKENIIGCQFHPEKSGVVGLNFLKNIINNYND